MHGPLNVECQTHHLVKCLTFLSDCIQIWNFLTVLSFMFYRNPSIGRFTDMCRQLDSQMGVTKLMNAFCNCSFTCASKTLCQK